MNQTEAADLEAEAYRILSSAHRASDTPSSARLLSRVRACEEGRALLDSRPIADGETIDLEDLMRLPHGTFGREYAEWMQEHGLRPPDSSDDTRSGASADALYLCDRIVQVHDFWHVLSGYDCDEDGELALLAFSAAQTRAPALSAHLREAVRRELRFAWRTGDSTWPHRLVALWRAWRRGRRARFLVPVALEDDFILPIDSVRQRLGIQPARG